MFWNVAGLSRKDRDFWDYLKKFDIVNLTETWIEEKGWKKIEYLLPTDFNWEIQYAKRDKKKGRGSGGIITGIRKAIEKESVQKDSQGIISCDAQIGKEKWRIISIYNREGKKALLEEMEELIEKEGHKKTIIGGDFNARTAEKGGILWNGEEEDRIRKSKDKTENRQGVELIETVEKMGLGLLNGNIEGDEQGEWTFVGTLGSSVIDYAICNAEAWDVIDEFKVGERTESDHMPLELILQTTAEAEIEQETEKEKEKEKEEEKEVVDWSEEGATSYKEERKAEKEGIQEEWDELVEEVRKAVCKRVIRVKKTKIGEKKWWDKECRASRKRLNRVLRQMKRGGIERRSYTEERQKHNKLCGKKQREEREREQKKIMEITNETEIWKYIKKERGGREKPDNSIGEEQWKRHFMELLEGRDTREKNKEPKEQQEEVLKGSIEESTDDITEEEVGRAIARLKKKKAAGEDGIKNEAWL
ncbi:uncharacterized protein [Temnothorax nylanderi]|uniref:uncharacterized protein n=1 Tax=Temnothorax nylanderi TaxID=102681 RepID=UPI003A8A1415